MEGTFREETVYAVVFWLGEEMNDRYTLAAFLPVYYEKDQLYVIFNNFSLMVGFNVFQFVFYTLNTLYLHYSFKS